MFQKEDKDGVKRGQELELALRDHLVRQPVEATPQRGEGRRGEETRLRHEEAQSW